MDVKGRIEKIEYKILVREAQISDLESEIESLKRARARWKKVLTKRGV